MTLVSPLPIAECRAALREQVATPSWSRRLSPFRKWTSRVIGQIGETEVVLESATDLFSKTLVGRLQATPQGTTLEGSWVRPFWTRVWGNERFDEEEIFRFLQEYGHFTQQPP
jgi:hypothetical protein